MWTERPMGTLIVLLLILQTVISGLIVWRLNALGQALVTPRVAGPQLSVETESIDLTGQPGRGSAAPVMTLVEFSDATCSACRRIQPMLDAFLERHGDRVRHVVQTFPLRPEGPSMEVALAGRCAHRQGEFWALQEALLTGPSAPTSVEVVHLADEAGLDLPVFEACLEDPSIRHEVEQAVAVGRRLGVDGTPTFFVNGRRLRGVPREDDLNRLLASLEAADVPAG